MPGGDGRGPSGFGPMTGRGAGLCAGYSMPGYANSIPGRGFGFRGRGRGGFGGGFGRGFGRAYPYYGYGVQGEMPYGQVNMNPQQEADMLKHQATAMEKEIKDINERISVLDKAAKEEK